MGVEPTIRSAKERITGFEGREDHRTLSPPSHYRPSLMGSLYRASGVCNFRGWERYQFSSWKEPKHSKSELMYYRRRITSRIKIQNHVVRCLNPDVPVSPIRPMLKVFGK